MPSRRRAHAVQPPLQVGDDRAVSIALRTFFSELAATKGRGGEGEARLGGPLERLIASVGNLIGVSTVPYGQVSLKSIRARPDYAVDVANVRVGYIELKSPDRKALPPDWHPSRHDRDQWEKLRLLPNLIYTNGAQWRLFHYGAPAGPEVAFDDPGGTAAKAQAIDVLRFESMLREFLLWEPESPRSLRQLITVMAGLCRLLRDEVSSIFTSSGHSQARDELRLLAADWRDLLFPDLDDARFSDSYAQTITFSLLLAQISGVPIAAEPLHEIGRKLGKKHALIGRALAVLADSDVTPELSIIDTIRRVIATVDWSALDDSHTDTYVELYERFLAEYDPRLRKESGTYYTPEPVARFMVDFVNEVLVDRLGISWGLADNDVVVIDPAMGTGTFLVEVVRVVAEIVERRQGLGARTARLRELFRSRLVGFEKQVAPYAVTELRLHQALKARFDTDIPTKDVRFLADTLEDPNIEAIRLSAANKVLERAKAEANRVKRETPVMVVIGNPPHLSEAKGKAPWVEAPRKSGFDRSRPMERPSMDEFRAPSSGRYESDLHGLHWYFWRWAMWKVFDAHPDQSSGAVAFISPSSFMTGRAFAGMRAYIRDVCDEGWIIDVSPEDNRSDGRTRLFTGVQRRLCIAVFARYGGIDHGRPAQIHHLAVDGTRDEKLARLFSLGLDDDAWVRCSSGPEESLLPEPDRFWASLPTLDELMPWGSRGVTTGRGWTYAPEPSVLVRRWARLMTAGLEERRRLFREGRDRQVTGAPRDLPGFGPSRVSIALETGECPTPIRVGYRSFDRQWLIPDGRLMEMPRESLWTVRSDRQLFITEQNAHVISSGSAITITALIPDTDHFNGRGGRVIPLYRDAAATEANIAPGLLRHLSERLGRSVTSDDFVSYIAGVAAHPGFTERFKACLEQPGIRVPLTADPALWDLVTALGADVVWLHSFGERGSSACWRDLAEMVESRGPRVLRTIPDTSEGMPDDFAYDAETGVLTVGEGAIGRVPPTVMAFSAGGFPVVSRWIARRLKNPKFRRKTSPLDDLNCERWTARMTDELLELLTVLGECLEVGRRQAAALSRVLEGPMISRDELLRTAVLPVPEPLTRGPRASRNGQPEIF